MLNSDGDGAIVIITEGAGVASCLYSNHQGRTFEPSDLLYSGLHRLKLLSCMAKFRGENEKRKHAATFFLIEEMCVVPSVSDRTARLIALWDHASDADFVSLTSRCFSAAAGASP